MEELFFQIKVSLDWAQSFRSLIVAESFVCAITLYKPRNKKLSSKKIVDLFIIVSTKGGQRYKFSFPIKNREYLKTFDNLVVLSKVVILVIVY
ncbi:hypothetical protein AB406_1501 [Riemerella anatipestifer]|uniref:Uncharacterized protein n=1 Tax=Riemerella anatipestifer TaxID=34085 RepID=A0A1S7DTL1_RIEAN|nr:hypothetical protein AB406_1501 [Riemerella anatipestifer]